jgi:hypothetical protein
VRKTFGKSFFSGLISILFIACISIGESSLAETKFLSWADLTYKAVTEGERTDAYGGIFKTLSIVQPLDDDGSYEADHFSGVGGEDAYGKFHASQYQAVSEQWRIDQNGNWNIDQWLFKMDVDGLLTWVAHFQLIELPNGTVLEHRSIEVSKGEGAAKLRDTLKKF